MYVLSIRAIGYQDRKLLILGRMIWTVDIAADYATILKRYCNILFEDIWIRGGVHRADVFQGT